MYVHVNHGMDKLISSSYMCIEPFFLAKARAQKTFIIWNLISVDPIVIPAIQPWLLTSWQKWERDIQMKSSPVSTCQWTRCDYFFSNVQVTIFIFVPFIISFTLDDRDDDEHGSNGCRRLRGDKKDRYGSLPAWVPGILGVIIIRK